MASVEVPYDVKEEEVFSIAPSRETRFLDIKIRLFLDRKEQLHFNVSDFIADLSVSRT